uniref:Uncharacterized protein n=1 Tax=Ixodes ricinus TaxID=34613 RepID=A0A6B0UYI9_IXORI
MVDSVFELSLGLLGVPGATLCLAQRANGCIAMDLLVAGQACLHGRGLLAEGRGLGAFGESLAPPRLLHLLHRCGQGRGQGCFRHVALVPLCLLLLEKLWLEGLVLLVQFWQLLKTNFQPELVDEILERLVLVMHLLGTVQVLVPVLFGLLDDGLHHINVGMDLPQFLDVGHLFLKQ